MQDISKLGFFVLLIGSLISVWSKSLNRKKVISNGQEVRFQYPEGWKAFLYLSKKVESLAEELKFQYPEGWKAFRYKKEMLHG